jgi:hypothetical protein
MNMECIAYKKGYKYQLNVGYSTDTSIRPDEDVSSSGNYVTLTKDGKLTLKEGYAWDGPSGPTIDTPNFMRGSLVHDAFYQLMREEKLDRNVYREKADRLLQEMCIQDGMTTIRAWWVYQGVARFAESASHPRNRKEVIKAPKSCR